MGDHPVNVLHIYENKQGENKEKCGNQERGKGKAAQKKQNINIQRWGFQHFKEPHKRTSRGGGSEA